MIVQSIVCNRCGVRTEELLPANWTFFSGEPDYHLCPGCTNEAKARGLLNTDTKKAPAK